MPTTWRNYLSSVYADEELLAWFVDAYKATGKKLDMGKSCVRFSRLDNLPVEVIGQAIGKVSLEEFLDYYRDTRS